MNKIERYIKIPHIGNRIIADIFDGEVEISSKIDGSNWRVLLSPDGLMYGSRKVDMPTDQMFGVAIEQSERIYNDVDWQDIGNEIMLFTEFLANPKHNTLTYDRVPLNHLYLFAAIVDDEVQDTHQLELIADVLDVEPPHIIHTGTIENSDQLNAMLDTDSVLGGTTVEGIVIKNYNHNFDPLVSPTFSHMPLTGKIVNESFKERNKAEWKLNKSVIDNVCEQFLTVPRFNKAIQHVKEEGSLEGEKRDLKYLIPEFYNDLMKEEYEDIRRIVMTAFLNKLRKKADQYVVQSYINHLTEQAFEQPINDNDSM